MAPNYQAGKEIIAGVLATLKGNAVGQSLYKLGEGDFQAEISKLRAAKPDAVLFFGPGAMGVSFVKQWHASGAGKEIKLFAHYVADESTLGAIGEAAVGTLQITSWPKEAGNEANAAFMKAYIAKFNRQPSFFAAQSYDGPRLIAAALKKVSGKHENTIEFMRVMRHTPYPSTRPYLGFNSNGLPLIQYYKSEIVLGQSGKPEIKVHGTVAKSPKYTHLEECPEANRL
jgi:branched-chain amino acid transport system substrate-binding protein